MSTRVMVIVVAALLAACAGTVPPRPDGFEAYTAAQVRVLSEVRGSEARAQQLQQRLIDTLRARQVFAAVGPATEDLPADGVTIEVRITRLVKVITPLRIAQGGMAGSNEVGADVVLIDAATQLPLSRFRLHAESPDYPPATDWPRGTLEIAMDRFAAQLAKTLLAWRQPGG